MNADDLLTGDQRREHLARLHDALLRELVRRLTSPEVASEKSSILDVARKLLSDNGINAESLARWQTVDELKKLAAPVPFSNESEAQQPKPARLFLPFTDTDGSPL